MTDPAVTSNINDFTILYNIMQDKLKETFEDAVDSLAAVNPSLLLSGTISDALDSYAVAAGGGPIYFDYTVTSAPQGEYGTVDVAIVNTVPFITPDINYSAPYLSYSTMGSITAPVYNVNPLELTLPELPTVTWPVMDYTVPTLSDIVIPTSPDLNLPSVPTLEDIAIPNPPDFSAI